MAARLRLTEGAELVTSTLKRLGYKIGIISGGFDYFGRRLQEQLGFDYMYANRLEIADGCLTGRVLGEIIDGPRKAALLREIAATEGLRLEQTIAVGDGANDLPMLSIAGLGDCLSRQAGGAPPGQQRHLRHGAGRTALPHRHPRARVRGAKAALVKPATQSYLRT